MPAQEIDTVLSKLTDLYAVASNPSAPAEQHFAARAQLATPAFATLVDLINRLAVVPPYHPMTP